MPSIQKSTLQKKQSDKRRQAMQNCTEQRRPPSRLGLLARPGMCIRKMFFQIVFVVSTGVVDQESFQRLCTDTFRIDRLMHCAIIKFEVFRRVEANNFFSSPSIVKYILVKKCILANHLIEALFVRVEQDLLDTCTEFV